MTVQTTSLGGDCDIYITLDGKTPTPLDYAFSSISIDIGQAMHQIDIEHTSEKFTQCLQESCTIKIGVYSVWVNYTAHTTLHDTILRCTTIRHTTLDNTTLHDTILKHYTSTHYTTSHHITSHHSHHITSHHSNHITPRYTISQYTTLHHITSHHITSHNTMLCYAILYCDL